MYAELAINPHTIRDKFVTHEALLSWEAIYTVVKWYVEVYGPIDVTVPDYLDPAPQAEKKLAIVQNLKPGLSD